MQPDWVASLQAQCARAKVLFFFKQWGGVQKSKYGRILKGRTYDDMPARAMTPIPSRAECRALAQ
jgi:protein gp37